MRGDEYERNGWKRKKGVNERKRSIERKIYIYKSIYKVKKGIRSLGNIDLSLGEVTIWTDGKRNDFAILLYFILYSLCHSSSSHFPSSTSSISLLYGLLEGFSPNPLYNFINLITQCLIGFVIIFLKATKNTAYTTFGFLSKLLMI